MCGEKQSLKTVSFKGCGKDCRLQVQKLNESKVSCIAPNVSPCIGKSNGVAAEEAREAAKAVTEVEWSDLIDEDSDWGKDFEEESTEHTTILEKCDKEKNKTDQNHRQSIELSELNEVPSMRDHSEAKRIHENVTNYSSEFEVLIAKLPKMDNNISSQPDWDQFLPDELSD